MVWQYFSHIGDGGSGEKMKQAACLRPPSEFAITVTFEMGISWFTIQSLSYRLAA